jgi:protein TonB
MFDDALIESGRHSSSGNRRGSLPLAIGLHAGVLGTLIGAAAWSTGEPPEPEIRVAVVFPGAPAPPPRGGGPVPEVRRPNASPRAIAPILSEPRLAAVPSPLAPTDHVAIADEPADSLEGGVDGDGGTGVPGGTNPTGGVVGMPGTSGEPIPVVGDVRPPQLLSRVEPDYPEAMRRIHAEGVVILEAVITASGDVESVRVLKSANPALDRSAADAIRRWRYRAATLNGRPVAVYLTVTVSFGLRS